MSLSPTSEDAELGVIERRFHGRIRVQKKLGQGGMGAVYRVERDGEVYALKVLLKSALGDETAMRRFLLEGQVLQKIQHPNVMRLIELGEEGDWPYILCEFVEGESLDALLEREGALSWDRALEIATRMLEGLAAAHAAEVIHRDIKPSNVLIGPGGLVKLADFGIAKAQKLESKQTTTGMIVGTPAYIAPEILRGEKPTAKADVYSTGVVLFELLTGRLPWSSKEAGTLLTERFTATEIPSPTDFRPDLPKSLDTLVGTALDPKPINRYLSANLFRAAIENTRKQLTQNLGAPKSTMAMTAPRASGAATMARISGRNRTIDESLEPPLPRKLPAAGARPVAEAGAGEERRLWLVGAIVLGLLACITVWAIARTRPAGTASVTPTGTEVDVLGPGPAPAEAALFGDLRQGTGTVLEQAVERALKGADPRRAQLLYRAWDSGGAAQRVALRDALARCEHALAIPALAEILQDRALAQPVRQEAGRQLDALVTALEDNGFPHESCPRRDKVALQLCDVLTAATSSTEETVVLRAAVRGVGWLRDPATTPDCMRGLESAQSAGQVDRKTVLHALDQFTAGPAASAAQEVRKQLLRESGLPGLAGPSPQR